MLWSVVSLTVQRRLAVTSRLEPQAVACTIAPTWWAVAESNVTPSTRLSATLNSAAFHCSGPQAHDAALSLHVPSEQRTAVPEQVVVHDAAHELSGQAWVPLGQGHAE